MSDVNIRFWRKVFFTDDLVHVSGKMCKIKVATLKNIYFYITYEQSKKTL